ncbi:hypothetical protein V492_07008 [Pseudogymnoascus sp. VKM F-4246]|nr:hypothetical protein V492_07008 [Pseudogymnoascus sp. VKM F-4246]
MLFPTLPLEIILLVADNLDKEKDISLLMRTSKRNYQLLLPFLYAHNLKKYGSRSALIWCVDHDNETGVKLFLELGADATKGSNPYYPDSKLLPDVPVGPLHFAKSDDMVRLLLDAGADVNDSPHQWGTPLHGAADRGDVSLAKFLLENGAHVDVPNANAATPLHIAAELGDLDMATLLLDTGADVNACGIFDINTNDMDEHQYHDRRGTALHFALLNKEDTGLPMTKLLLDRGAHLEKTDNQLATPLHIAARNCSQSTVKLILDHGAAVNIQDRWGKTPLFRAVEPLEPGESLPGGIKRPDQDITKLLLDHGALANIRDDAGVTALFETAYHKDAGIARLLLDYGAQVNPLLGGDDSRSPLHEAIECGVEATVELLLSRGALVDEITRHGETCLHLVTDRSGPALTSLTSLLLRHGAQVDRKTTSGFTALHRIVIRGRLTKQDLLLLKQGTLVKTVDDSEALPVDFGAQVRLMKLAIAKALLDYGSDFNIKDNSGKSVMDYAMENEKSFRPDLFVGQSSG